MLQVLCIGDRDRTPGLPLSRFGASHGEVHVRLQAARLGQTAGVPELGEEQDRFLDLARAPEDALWVPERHQVELSQPCVHYHSLLLGRPRGLRALLVDADTAAELT